ncbi:hypothetical protein BDZ89DRAFT_1124815 [Hymenopellis radicata]|nr:hypothetical protein BDZ89DRAFT_1124815 [Hymenopellis radicata]
MRFFTVLATFAAVSVASASPPTSTDLNVTMSKDNYYGAGPIRPWEAGCKPGWYYGDFPNTLENDRVWLKDKATCALLDPLPQCMHCPKPKQEPSKTYTVTEYDCAIQSNIDYLTYGLVDTVEGMLF